jgi:hypothetical protein
MILPSSQALGLWSQAISLNGFLGTRRSGIVKVTGAKHGNLGTNLDSTTEILSSGMGSIHAYRRPQPLISAARH